MQLGWLLESTHCRGRVVCPTSGLGIYESLMALMTAYAISPTHLGFLSPDFFFFLTWTQPSPLGFFSSNTQPNCFGQPSLQSLWAWSQQSIFGLISAWPNSPATNGAKISIYGGPKFFFFRSKKGPKICFYQNYMYICIFIIWITLIFFLIKS